MFEDDDLLVVDKPAFVPCQAAREGAHDDLPTRLQRFLSQARGLEVTLGTHQRLDALTSGLVVYAKSAAANGELARAFEGRTVDKRYVAVVSGPGRPPEGRLTDRLVFERGMSRIDARGDEAACTVSVMEMDRGRALVSIQLETGRTHQIRAQLAARGWPVVGDPLYGGQSEARLMLHAERLSLPSRPAFHAPLPPDFARALHGHTVDALLDPVLLRERLLRARERRYGLGHRKDTTAFRLVHGAADGLTGLAVDVYGDYLVAHLYRDDVEEPVLLDALASLGFAGVYLKRRPAQANELGDEGARALAPTEAVAGLSAPNEGTILEHGVPYAVRLGDGLSTGLFLDQREMRSRIAERVGEGHLLNLFAYTCGFSIAAARLGARTTSVDASRAALERGRAGLALVGGELSRHRFMHDDAFEVLARLARRKEQFQVIVCDPPTYSKSKKTRFTSSRTQWNELFAQCLSVLAPGGLLYATSNDQRMTQRSFREMARDGAKLAGVTLTQCKDLTAQEDFPPQFDGTLHLKGVLLTRS